MKIAGRRRMGAAAVLAGTLGCAHARQIAEPLDEPLPAVWRDRAGVRLSSSPGGLLRDGAEALIQRRLVALGLLKAGQVTGRLDDATTRALRRFQATAALAETGLPSYETVRELKVPLQRVFVASPG